MAATKTQAFVLKTRDYRDTSLLADFYTRDYGKLRGIVKGIRDARGRFGSTLEPFSLNEILFYRRRRGGDLHQVTQVELLDLFDGVRNDLERLAYASYFIDLLNAFVEPEESNPAIFDLLRHMLLFMAAGASAKRAARIFEVKLLELLGWMPEVRACVVCRVPSPVPAYFSSDLGGVHCQACCTRLTGGQGRARHAACLPAGRVSRGTLHFLEHVQRSQVQELVNVKVSQDVGRELERLLRRFVDFHLSNPLKSILFLQKMEL